MILRHAGDPYRDAVLGVPPVIARGPGENTPEGHGHVVQRPCDDDVVI